MQVDQNAWIVLFLHFNTLNICRNICRILLNVEHPGKTLDLKKKLDYRGGVQQGVVSLFNFRLD